VVLIGLLLLASCGGTEATPTFISPPVPATPTTVVDEGGITIAQYSEYPTMIIDVSKQYTATINTSQGNFTVELFAKDAPKTVNSFVFLAQEGFYNGVIFHRVIKNFMIQGGDPTGTGTGGPGYKFEDEIVPTLVFDRKGLLAMANSGPGTNGSQFFITTAPTDWLNGKHTIFGEVSQGQAVLDTINGVAVGANDKPIEPVVIESILIN